ncbi:MAG: ankyrin-3-like isoform [Gammaproteobacteria bacterium]|jgi:hypothetical protein|nr:ankyrin-3-like isoform [Gammaproteobacteria bacterium]
MYLKKLEELILKNSPTLFDEISCLLREKEEAQDKEDISPILLLAASRFAKPSNRFSAAAAASDATVDDHLKVLQCLITEGHANVNVRNINGLTPLHIAATKNDTAMGELLIQNQADIDALAQQQFAPLHLAARYGSQQFIELLLLHGATIDGPDLTLRTPLHLALKNKQIACAKTLINKGAKQIENNLAKYPLSMALESFEATKEKGYLEIIGLLLPKYLMSENFSKLVKLDTKTSSRLITTAIALNTLLIYLQEKVKDKDQYADKRVKTVLSHFSETSPENLSQKIKQTLHADYYKGRHFAEYYKNFAETYDILSPEDKACITECINSTLPRKDFASLQPEIYNTTQKNDDFFFFDEQLYSGHITSIIQKFTDGHNIKLVAFFYQFVIHTLQKLIPKHEPRLLCDTYEKQGYKFKDGLGLSLKVAFFTLDRSHAPFIQHEYFSQLLTALEKHKRFEARIKPVKTSQFSLFYPAIINHTASEAPSVAPTLKPPQKEQIEREHEENLGL